ISAIGAPILEGKKVIIQKGKQLPLETLKDSLIEFCFGIGAECLRLEKNAIPESWNEAVEKILGMKNPKVIVIGDVDSGKSTFCTYLINKTIDKGINPIIIDADIGQSDLGPPTTIGLGIAKEYALSLSSLNIEKLLFIGYTSPSLVKEKVINGIKKLIEIVHEQKAPIIINTDGWIMGEEAISYKIKMLSEISPDIVIGMAKDDELNQIINSRKENSIVIKVPEIVKKRSKEERKMFREQKYWNYLKNAQSFWLKVDELEVHGLDLKEGRILSKEELKEFSKTLSLNVLYGEDLGKTINLWVDKIPSSKLLENFECLIKERKINVISVSEKRNLILGLLDKDGFLKGIGILRGIDFKKRALKIYAPYFSEIKKIDAGKVKLSKNGKELTH
ncbi:MAG: Clp1/GlmU family protein, partial [Candidatus Bathyarchaeia archaeon]